jgi:hypothetical protein
MHPSVDMDRLPTPVASLSTDGNNTTGYSARHLDMDLSMRTSAHALTTLTLTTLLAVAGSACVGDVGGGESTRTRKPKTTGEEPKQDGDCEQLETAVTIRASADYDKLPTGCWDLYATLRVEGSAITSLHRLGKLAAVNDLEIVDTNLTTLDVEQPFEVWGAITISGNSKLTSIDKIRIQDADDLTTAYTIRNNALLTGIAGIGYAKEVEGELRITDNPKLGAITFDELTTAAAVTISGNGATSLDLGSLQQVNRLEISNNAQLTTIIGAAASTVRGDLVLRGNRALAQLGTWSSLSRVEGTLTIDDNDALLNLGGISTMQYVTGAVAVTNNGAITAIDAVSRLQGIGTTVAVTGNTNLDGCRAWEIYYCVQSGPVTINNNKPNTGSNQGSNCPRFWCE